MPSYVESLIHRMLPNGQEFSFKSSGYIDSVNLNIAKAMHWNMIYIEININNHLYILTYSYLFVSVNTYLHLSVHIFLFVFTYIPPTIVTYSYIHTHRHIYLCTYVCASHVAKWFMFAFWPLDLGSNLNLFDLSGGAS